MMKRLISSLLVVCLLMTSFTLVYGAPAADVTKFDDIEATEHRTPIELLAVLGLVEGDGNGSFNPDNTVTRAEFVTMVLRIIGIHNGATPPEAHPFEDVRGHWAENVIYYAWKMGMVNGKSDTVFGVNDPVSYYEATKIIVEFLGYGPVAESKGGYPVGYFFVAKDLDILDDMREGERALTRGETARIFYNALPVGVVYDLSDVLNVGNDILTSMGYTKMQGTVTSAFDAQQGASLTPLQVEIDGKRFKVISQYRKNLIGASVIYYIDDNDLIYYIEEIGEAETITVKGEDVDPSSTFTAIKYYDENGRFKTQQLAVTGLKVYYNGKLLSSLEMDTARLRPASGEVVIRDSNNDGTYETVVITDYQTMVIRSIVGDLVYGKLGEKLDLTPLDINFEIIYGSNELSIDDLSVGMILTVAKSLDGERVSVKVSEKSIKGTITQISDDEGYYVDGDDAGYYELTTEYKNAVLAMSDRVKRPELGLTATFLINTEGQIADIVISEDDEANDGLKYGYLVDTRLSTDMTSTLYFKILTEDNTFEDFSTIPGKDVKFGALRGTYSQTMTPASDIEAYYRSSVAVLGATLDKRIITYRTDDNGNITELNFPDASANVDHLSYDKSIDTYYYSQGLIDQQYVVDRKTAVFCIPNNGQFDDIYASGKYTDFFTNGSFNMAMYDIENQHVGAILYLPTRVRRYENDTKGFETIIDKVNSSVMYINSTARVVVDDETVTEVRGYVDGEETIVYVGNMLNGLSEPASGIVPGKVIQYETNTIRTSRALTSDETPQMVIYKTLFDCTNSAEPQKMTYEYDDIEISRPAISTIHSHISNLGNGYIHTDIGKGATITAGTAVMRWDSVKKEFEKVDQAELAIGQRIFIRQRYLVGREIVILDN